MSCNGSAVFPAPGEVRQDSIAAGSMLPEHRAGGVTLRSDRGTGRAFVALVDDPEYLPMVEAIAGYIEASARSVVLESSAVTGTSWRFLSEQVQTQLVQLGVRQASLIGIGACATLAQSIALREPKSVRSMVVVDAATRPHPSRWERFVDAIERRLPFGLPLRLGAEGFNVRSYSHRFRCPLLLITTRRAGNFVREELRAFATLAPTAWRVDLSGVAGEDEARRVAETLEAFQSTPAKCPQRAGRER